LLVPRQVPRKRADSNDQDGASVAGDRLRHSSGF
jgi:hypothetical protein